MISKTLKQLLRNTNITEATGSLDTLVTSVHVDSRQVKPGGLFIAVRGSKTDGHQYIDQAIKNGAAGILCEKLPEQIHNNVIYIITPSNDGTVSEIAACFYDYPDRDLTLIATTGTNGKTTVTLLVQQLLKSLGVKSGYISTIEAKAIDNVLVRQDDAPTTPGPIEIQRLLWEMKQHGCTHVAMEASSHALDQGRLKGLFFRVAIFTNLTQDHLDYHRTMEEYGAAKQQLFTHYVNQDGFVITNTDDGGGKFMVAQTPGIVATYGTNAHVDYQIKLEKADASGTIFTINGQKISSPLLGDFNAYNLTAALACLDKLGLPLSQTSNHTQNLFIPGRVQITKYKERTGVIDYAHSPDGIDKVLQSLRPLTSGKLITITGAGGDRDKKKRPLMTRAALAYSDILILTSDNPRSENPADIIADMEEGVEIAPDKKIQIIYDRTEAISKAVELSQPGDIIAVLGKGHENYQEINGQRLHFDDKETLELAFASFN